MNHFLQTLWNLLQYHLLFTFRSFGHEARGIPVPRQGLNPHPPCWKWRSQPLDHQESSSVRISYSYKDTSHTELRSPLQTHFNLIMSLKALLMNIVTFWDAEGCSSPGGTVVKNPPANARDTRDAGSIPGSGRSPGVGNGNPIQYSCLENPVDTGAW